MRDIEVAFDKKFGISESDLVFHKRKDSIGGRQMQKEQTRPKLVFGVIKWFNPRKEPCGYIVTTSYGFEGIKKGDSDFVEIPFSRTIFAKGFTPRTRSLVVFTAERPNGKLCASSMRDAQFTFDDFRLALKYATHGIFKISGVSTKSANDWSCDIHILKELSKGGVLIDANTNEAKGWLSSYLHGQPELMRKNTIEVWGSDGLFAGLVSKNLIPSLRMDTPIPHHSQVPNSESGKPECEVDVMPQNQVCPDVDNDIVRAAQNSLNNAAQEQLNRMYASKLGNRLNELDTPTDYDRRRWVWELIQNAKDSIANSNDKNSVRIHLEINDDTLHFEHNGSPFNSNTVFALQYQYSQDKRNQEESTGRFGTGFMTTHCLSRVVGVKGDLVCDLGICGFSFDLHREGNTYDEIIDCLNKSEKSKQFFPKPFGKTTFTYRIGSESAKRAVALGVDEIRKHSCAVMCFCPEIESISVSNNGNLYTVNLESRNDIAEGVSQVTFAINDNGKDIRRAFLMASLREDCDLLSQKYVRPRKARIDAAIEINEISNSIVECEKDSSVFCVFPVIGAEQQLQEPFLFNSPDFELTTERDALYLSGADSNDNGKPSNVAINKMIFEKSSLLFGMIIDCLIAKHVNKFYFLTNGLRSIKEHKHLDGDWYKVHVQNEHRRILREAKVIDPSTGGERMALTQSFIVDESSTERANEVVALMSALKTGGEVKCPIKDNDEWAKRLWHEENIQVWDVKSLCKYVSGKGKWDNLPLQESITQIDWFNRFLVMALKFEEPLLGQMPLIPDMLGDLHSNKDKGFEQCEGVDEFVVGLLDKLGKDVRHNLMHRGITGIALSQKFGPDRFCKEIDALVLARKKACLYRGADNNQYWDTRKVIDAIWPLIQVKPTGNKCSDKFKERRAMTSEVLRRLLKKEDAGSIESDALTEDAWNNCDGILMEGISCIVAGFQRIKALIPNLCQNEEEAFDMLNTFYGWITVMGGDFNDKKLFPNQLGELKLLKDLQYEEDPNDRYEVIKNMVAKLEPESDFRRKLMDNRCKCSAKPQRITTSKDMCDYLDCIIDNRKNTHKDDEVFRDCVRDLLDDWEGKNEEDFRKKFPRASRNYSELELTVVLPKEVRNQLNQLYKIYGPRGIERLASGIPPEGVFNTSSVTLHQGKDTNGIAMALSDGRMGGLSKEEMKEAQTEAKLKAKEMLETEGFVLTKGICEEDFTLINGVMKDDLEYPVVVRSYKDESRQFQLSTTDWDQLVKPNSKLLVLKRDGRIYSVNFRELIAKREKIDLSFSTHNLDIGERIGQLATVLRWFEGLKFDFDKLTATRAGVVESFDLPEQGIPEGQRDHELSPNNPLEVF